MEETVSGPMDSQFSGRTMPVFRSPERFWKSLMYIVWPLTVAHLINARPPNTPVRMPAVAKVMAMSVASVQPISAKVAPTAAAVPCPPRKPAASSRPKLLSVWGQILVATRTASRAGSHHCREHWVAL